MQGESHAKEPIEYKAGSLSLTGAVSMGTGVMIGAGILALTGQIAELAASLSPLYWRLWPPLPVS